MSALDCGHEPRPTDIGLGTGVVYAPDGKSMCYSCADDAQRAQMARGEAVTAYTSADGKRITTWSGGELARVQSIGYGARRWGSVIGDWRMRYVRAIDPAGRVWRGQGSDQYDVITLRPA